MVAPQRQTPSEQVVKGSGIKLEPGDRIVRVVLGAARLLARYHRHRVVHLERLGNLAVARRGGAALRRLHARVWAECQTFLDAAVAARERSAPPLDRAIRWAERRLGDLGL